MMSNFRPLKGIGLMVLAAILLGGCQSQPGPSSQSTQFAIIGDNPYADYARERYERMIDRINANTNVDWVVHVGDMKDGVGDCSDASLESLYMLNQQFRAPFMVTPGDNDWFDCKREQSGGYDRLDRLDKLREIFYTAPTGLSVVSQRDTSVIYRDFVENVYWMDNGVLFANVHLIGTSGEEGGLGLHFDVQDAAIEWVRTVFDVAQEMNAAGVFIATQADIYPFSGDPGWLRSLCIRCAVVRPLYEPFHEALVAEAFQFTKPILLAVGDTHVFRVDKPMYDGDQLVEHFTRVEAFGEDQVHWVRVVVKPDTPQVFHIYQEIIPENTGPPPGKEEN